LPVKEIREIVLVHDDCPPTFVFNHLTNIRNVSLKCNYNFSQENGAFEQ
jgi:hypothetical protein